MSPEVKERVLAKVNELIDCCDDDPCHCDDAEDRELAWYEEGQERDNTDDRRDVLREREWDRD